MLAIIPAKKTSKRLPNKNIKLFSKEPLIAHTIKSALKSKCVTRIIVSTDSRKIAKIAIKYGAEVPFLRSKNLSGAKTTTWEVCKNVIKKLKKTENNFYESFIYLQPTSPLRSPQDIDNAIKIFKNKKANAVVSVHETKPEFWFKNITRKGILVGNNKNNKKNYILNGSIYIFKTKFIEKTKANEYDDKTFAYVTPQERSIDIDTLYDFKIAEFFLKK
jgi:CMP-N,N'-diacetyllegionaminic acid synthase